MYLWEMHACVYNMSRSEHRKYALASVEEMHGICEQHDIAGELLLPLLKTLHETLRTALDAPKMLALVDSIVSSTPHELQSQAQHIGSVVQQYAQHCTPHEAWLFEQFEAFLQSMYHTAFSLDRHYEEPHTQQDVLSMILVLADLTRTARARRQELLEWVLSPELVQPDLGSLLLLAIRYNATLQSLKGRYPAISYINTDFLSNLMHALNHGAHTPKAGGAPNKYACLDAYEQKALARNSEENPYSRVTPLWEKSNALPKLLNPFLQVHGDSTLPDIGDLQAYKVLLQEIQRRKPELDKKLKPNPPPEPIFLQLHHFSGMQYDSIEQEPECYTTAWALYPQSFSPAQKHSFREYDLRQGAWQHVTEMPTFLERHPGRGGGHDQHRIDEKLFDQLWEAYELRKQAWWQRYCHDREAFLKRFDVQAALAKAPPAFQAFVHTPPPTQPPPDVKHGM